jgi:hypothetical protein
MAKKRKGINMQGFYPFIVFGVFLFYMSIVVMVFMYALTVRLIPARVRIPDLNGVSGRMTGRPR